MVPDSLASQLLQLQRYFPNTLLCCEEALNQDTVSKINTRLKQIKVKYLFSSSSGLWFSLPLYIHFSAIFTRCKTLSWRPVATSNCSSGNIRKKKTVDEILKFTLTLRKMYQFFEADIQCIKCIIFLLKSKTLGIYVPTFLFFFFNIWKNLISWEFSWGYLIHLLPITTNHNSSNNNNNNNKIVSGLDSNL